MLLIRVGIDFDSTIARIAEPWLNRFNELNGTTHRETDWKDWELSFLSAKDRAAFFSLLTPELYADAEPYPDAAEVIARWSRRSDLELVCVTSNPATNSDAFTAAKTHWLKKYVPCLAHAVIAARVKSGLGLDVLIDDAPHHHVDGDYLSVLVRRPWNRMVACDLSFTHWSDANATLEKAIARIKSGRAIAR